MSHEDHLHQETNILKIKEHTVMIAAQYALKCHHPQHPNHDLTTLPDPPRTIRKSALVKYRDCVNLLPPPTSRRSLSRGIKTIHTSIVTDSIDSYQYNSVLGTKPPKISAEEALLSRITSFKLAQLRSGWCSELNNYRARLDESIPDTCPDCGSTPHDVHHLFNCSQHPTTLTVEALWTHPKEVSTFLNILNEDQTQTTDDN